MFCRECGVADVQGNFCSSCGAPTIQPSDSETSSERVSGVVAPVPDVNLSVPLSDAPSSKSAQAAGNAESRRLSAADGSRYSGKALGWALVGLLLFSPLGIVGLVYSRKAKRNGETYVAALVIGIITCVQTGVAVIALIVTIGQLLLGGVVIDSDKLVSEMHWQMARQDQWGLSEYPAVKCPQNMVGLPGDTFQCVATYGDGSSMAEIVTIRDYFGNVEWVPKT